METKQNNITIKSLKIVKKQNTTDQSNQKREVKIFRIATDFATVSGASSSRLTYILE